MTVKPQCLGLECPCHALHHARLSRLPTGRHSGCHSQRSGAFHAPYTLPVKRSVSLGGGVHTSYDEAGRVGAKHVHPGGMGGRGWRLCMCEGGVTVCLYKIHNTHRMHSTCQHKNTLLHNGSSNTHVLCTPTTHQHPYTTPTPHIPPPTHTTYSLMAAAIPCMGTDTTVPNPGRSTFATKGGMLSNTGAAILNTSVCAAALRNGHIIAVGDNGVIMGVGDDDGGDHDDGGDEGIDVWKRKHACADNTPAHHILLTTTPPTSTCIPTLNPHPKKRTEKRRKALTAYRVSH